MSWCKWALLSLVVLAGCKGGDQARVIEVPSIRTSAQADDYLVRAEKLSLEALVKSGRDEPLTSAEEDNVKESLAIFEGIIAFDPSRYQPYFGAGKLAYALKDYERADKLMAQAIALAPPASKNPPVELLMMVAEAHYVVSRSRFFMQDFEVAEESAKLAVTLIKESPDYWVALASAQLELKKEDDAKFSVLKALALDQTHARANQLAKLLKLP